MRSIREIFKNNPSLLDEPEVEELLEYHDQFQEEIMDFKFEKNKSKNKEFVMLEMVKDIIEACDAVEREQAEHERFGYDAPNYPATILNLKNYILKRCKDENIYL